MTSSSERPTARVIEGAYLADVLAQPAVLATVAESLVALGSSAALAGLLSSGRFKRIVLTGMGSSLHALYPLHLTLSDAGHTCVWVEAAELVFGFESFRAADTLLVVVSQSGRSAEVVQILKHTGAFGHVIGVTNDPASALGRSAHTTLLMNAGPEATVSCKTYVATLAVLAWLGAVLTGRPVEPVLTALRQCGVAAGAYLERWRDHTAALGPVVRGVAAVFVTGRGRSLAAAGTGGLILKESTRRPAEGMSCAAFRHGPLEMADDATLLVVLEGDTATAGLNRRLYDDVVAGGGRAAFVSAGDAASAEVWRLPDAGEAVGPILEILPVQMLSLALAARDGREAGRFERASKITSTE